jgi:hypothetical protein
MELKNCAWIALIISLVLPIAAFAAANQDVSKITVTPLRYEPFPAQPGAYVDVWLNIQNIGFEPADNLIVILEPQYPFSIDPNENATREIGTLNGMDSSIIDYKIRVAPDAVQGENELRLMFSSGDHSVWIEKILLIDVQTIRANLDIISIKNQIVAPGNMTSLEITLKNLGDSDLKDISVKLDLSDVPFYAVDSIAEKKLDLVKAGSEELMGFDLLASPSAACQPYQIPMTLSYKTLNGTQFTKSDFITLVVNANPDLVVNVESSTILTSGSTGSVILNLVNKGLTNIKFLMVTVNPGNYQILSPSQTYIGSLNSDDFDTAQYDLYVANASGSVPLNVTLDYRDANNNEYSQNLMIPLTIYTSSELTRYNLVPPPSYANLIIIIVIVLLIAYWLYRRRRKRK